MDNDSFEPDLEDVDDDSYAEQNEESRPQKPAKSNPSFRQLGRDYDFNNSRVKNRGKDAKHGSGRGFYKPDANQASKNGAKKAASTAKKAAVASAEGGEVGAAISVGKSLVEGGAKGLAKKYILAVSGAVLAFFGLLVIAGFIVLVFLGIFFGTSDDSALATCQNDFVGANNTEIVWNYFRSKNLSEYAVAGFMGNFAYESGFDPTKLNSGPSQAYGLAQWLGTRKQKLYDFATALSRSPDSLETQLDFAWFELTGSPPVDGLDGGGFQAAYNLVKASSSVDEATQIVFDKYEIPLDGSLAARTVLAQEAYTQFHGRSIPTSTSADCGGVGVGPDGFVFPMRDTTQSQVSWCSGNFGNCHGTAWAGTYYAYDIYDVGNDATIAAVADGTIVGFHPSYTCTAGPQLSLWVNTDDGYWYFYQHMDATRLIVSDGLYVEAGTSLGYLGDHAYVGGTCDDTDSHLHFAASTKRTNMLRGCTEERCPDMDGLFDVSSQLKDAYDALPIGG